VSGSGEEIENVKVYKEMDRQTDDGQRVIRKAHFRLAKQDGGK
jgi:hypothetical protein